MLFKMLQYNRFFQYADLIYRIADVKRSENLGISSLYRLRRKRFEALLYHVFKHSSFYNELYRSKGFTPEDIPYIKLEDLPVINKQIMMDNFDSFVCDKTLKKKSLEAFLANPGEKFHGQYYVIHTSGSTGQVGIFVYDLRSWNIIKALAMTRVSNAKLNPFKRIKSAFIGATDGHYAGITLARDVPKLFYDFRYIPINKPMQAILNELNGFKPTLISGYASSITLLADEQLKGCLSLNPKIIICSGDSLTDAMRTNIINAFSINPRNYYAASESLCMAAECEKHKGMHLFEDWHYFEVVDKELQAVDAGNPGHMLLTTLHNYVQPLIRYQLHDEISIDANGCTCGRNTTVVNNFSGRSEEFLWFTFPDGKREYLHPLQIVEFFIPGVDMFQIIQTEKNHLHMLIVAKSNAELICQKARSRIFELLSKKGLDKVVTFSCEIVVRIPLDSKTGKFKLIMPYRDK
jgi:phenylacetate-CoA ligase